MRTAMRDDDRPAITDLAVRQHDDRAAAVIARWLDDDRALFDVLRDRDGAVQGYLCSVVIAADGRGSSVARALRGAGGTAPGGDVAGLGAGRGPAGVAAPGSGLEATPPVLAPGTGPVAVTIAAETSAVVEPAPSGAARGEPSEEARELSEALDRRVAQLARSASLSPREREVLQLLLLGRNCAEIGLALQITPRTARFHQHNVLHKIGAESRLDIVRLLL